MTDPSNPQIEHAKWFEEKRREDAHRAHDVSSEFFSAVNKAAIDSANLALRTSILINGGAAVSVLAFIGAIVSRTAVSSEHIKLIAGSMMWFAYGVAAGLGAMTFAYITHYLMASIEGSKGKIWDHPYSKFGKHTIKLVIAARVGHALALIVGLSSLGLFVKGMLSVKDAAAHLSF